MTIASPHSDPRVHPQAADSLVLLDGLYQHIRPFLRDFTCTFVSTYRAFNADIQIAFLRPEDYIKDMFGLEREVAFVYSIYPEMQDRTVQAADEYLARPSAKGRVDESVSVILSHDRSIDQWLRALPVTQARNRLYLGHYVDGGLDTADSYAARKFLARHLFIRDLFEFTLPIENDTNFFGRDGIFTEVGETIGRSENYGLFGLRKTGKTSIAKKFERHSERFGVSAVAYFDLKDPQFRSATWEELLVDITQAIGRKLNIRVPTDTRPARAFRRVVERIPADQKAAIIFDEIEYITPFNKRDPHWSAEFVDLWQTLWSVQSEHRKIGYLVCGVNPAITEQSSINDTPDPMFSIVRPSYVRGLTLDEVRPMFRIFGRRMGLRFEPDAIEELHRRLGGHPRLLRKAASYYHDRIGADKRPFVVTSDDVSANSQSINGYISDYIEYIIEEVRRFYPDEYTILETVIQGDEHDARTLVKDEPRLASHLIGYGLLDRDTDNPRIILPAVEIFVQRNLRRNSPSGFARPAIQADVAADWYQAQADLFLNRVRTLGRLTRSRDIPALPLAEVPYAERIARTKPANDPDGLQAMMVDYHKSLIEPIDSKGRAQFFSEYKTVYPYLQKALHRIRVYRHGFVHTELIDSVRAVWSEFIESDLEGAGYSGTVSEVRQLQYVALVELNNAVEREIERIA